MVEDPLERRNLDYKRQAPETMGYRESWRGARAYLYGREDTQEAWVDVLGLFFRYLKRSLPLLGEGVEEH